MTGERESPTVVVTGAEVPEHPCASVTVTEKVPDDLTAILWVVSPSDQRYDAKYPGAISTTLSPVQNDSEPSSATRGAGTAMTFTVMVSEAPEHPPPLLTSTS